ncbi:MAG: hypothetical protein FIB08_05355 [Candidatus Methanoperedens sp.]|nr:hypothetical protein [Candidatus Methanoperedens sp.]
MGSRAIRGRIIDDSDRPISGLVVLAHGNYIWPFNQQLLGRITTDDEGKYIISYSSNRYFQLLGQYPDITIRILDRTGTRELAMTDKLRHINDDALNVPDIMVPRARAEGLAATLGGLNPSRLTKNNDAEVLIDGMAAFASMVAAVEKAQYTIHIIQLSFSPDLIATFTGGYLPSCATRPKDILAQKLLEASQRGVKVRILLNENLFAPSTVDELRDFFKNAGNNSVDVRPFPLVNNAVHAKSLTVDSQDNSRAETFIIGSPFEQAYWDTPDHLIFDHRRGSGNPGIGNKPIHDVCIRLHGPVIADVEEIFIQLWNFRSEEEHSADIIPQPGPLKAAGTQSVQLVRTFPAEILPGITNGETGILEAYQRAIGNAQDFIYLENQYFTSQTIANALNQALDTNPGLQIILLLNENTDVPAYKQLQNNLLEQLGTSHPRIGAFSLWKTSSGAGGIELKQCYIHSKVAVIDDRWGTVGSANLDGISMEAYIDIIEREKPPRNVEVNAVLFDGIQGEPATGKVAKMRHDLWAEHLGLQHRALDSPLAGGWLELWNNAARANIDSLNDNRTMKGLVLPYSPELSAKEQLISLGINISKFHIPD